MSRPIPAAPKPTFFSRFRNRDVRKTPIRTSTPPPEIINRNANEQKNPPQSYTTQSERRVNQIQAILEQPIIDLESIRAMSWAGIPDQYRARVWRLFLDYEPVNVSLTEQTLRHKRNDYFDCLERVYSGHQKNLWTNAQKGTIQQIQKDLPRTKVPLLRNERVRNMFERVLFVYSVRHPASGYVQGMNDVLRPFFYVFLLPHVAPMTATEVSELDNIDRVSEEDFRVIEADCFWCFSKLLDGLQDMYTKDQPGLYKMLEKLQNVVERTLPDLAQHIIDEDIQYQEFAFRWINCLLVREFSMEITFRIWDSYLSKHSQISSSHVYVCASLLSYLYSKIISLSHAEFVMYLQGISPSSWKMEEIEEILAQAYVYEKMFSASPSHLRSVSMPDLRNK